MESYRFSAFGGVRLDFRASEPLNVWFVIEPTRRPWEPGDGFRCSEARKASGFLPCGPPVVTETIALKAVGRAPHLRKRVLCANHASVGPAPHAILTEARKVAAERLVAEHWDVYQGYVNDAVGAIRARVADL